MIAAPPVGRVVRQIEREIAAHSARLNRAGVRALNKTATTVRQQASVEVRKSLNVKASYVKRLMTIRRANRSRPVSEIRSRYEAVPVIRFSGVRQTRKGVTVRMRKDKPRKAFSGAFIATMPSGHKGVFRRSLSATHRSKGRPTTSSPNLKISELRGPTVQGVFADKLDQIERLGEPILAKNLDREINYALSK